MRKFVVPLSLSALLMLSSSAGAGMFDSNGYPSKGRAIDALKPAPDYSEALKGRPLALGGEGHRRLAARPEQGVAQPQPVRLLPGLLLRERPALSGCSPPVKEPAT